MYKVKTREGKTVEFDIERIKSAIRRAFEATETEYNDDVLDLLALKVTANFQPNIKNNAIKVEDIQDSVESVLSNAGYAEVAKTYILYRKQHEKCVICKEQS